MRALMVMLLAALLVSCKLPSMAPPVTPLASADRPSALSLQGRVGAGRGVQAAIADIASAASVSLIDTASGQTVATTVTNPDGTFFLVFGTGFVPVDGRPYYLEALKGIKGGNPDYNQAGADTLRLRTVLYYRASEQGWVSLANATPGPIFLSMATTAVSLAIAHLGQTGTPVDPTLFIGCLAGETYTETGRPLTLANYTPLRAEVEKAISEDRDPLHYIVFDSKTGSFIPSFVGFAVSAITPTSGNIGTLVDIGGDGFTSGPLERVTINGTPAEIQPGTLAEDRVVVKVMPGTRTGPVSVVINGVVQAGPTFTVTMSDGHRSLKDNVLYVTNHAWGTVSAVTVAGPSAGEIRTLLDGLQAPRQAVVGPDGKIYVSLEGGNAIARFDADGGNLEPAFSTAVTKPYGLAFDAAGNLHVSSRQAGGSVVKLDATGNAVATTNGFTLPEAIAFNAGGDLFVAEDAGPILVLPAGAATPTAYSSVASPAGLAVDSAGDLYVASNANSVIYRIPPSRALTVFAMSNRPGGLTFDSVGNLFVSDTGRNLVSRISPNGDVKVLAYGISAPRGLAIDPSNQKKYVSLNESNAVLEIDGAILRPFVTGIANPLTLNFEGDGMYIAQPEIDTVSFVNRSKQLRTVATGVDAASGADRAADGTLYVGRWGRPSFRDPDRNPIEHGSYGVVAPDGTTTIRFPYNKDASYLAIDDSDADTNNDNDPVFLVGVSRRFLLMVTPHANGTRTVRQLFTFPSDPYDVTTDAAGNVYVAMPSENAIYRFKKAADYAQEAITGFNQPRGLAVTDTGALYVFNRGDGKLRWVTDAANGTTPSGESAALSTGLSSWSGVHEISFPRGAGIPEQAIYMAAGSKILRYDLALGTFEKYVDTPTVTQVDAWADGTIYARDHGNEVLRTISAAPIKSILASNMRSYGGAKDWNKRKVRFEQGTYGNAVWRESTVFLGSQALAHEVEVHGNHLYVASPHTWYDSAGVFRYELGGADPQELYMPGASLKAYSLAVAADGTVYAGNASSQIVELDAAGGPTGKTWALGTIPYGLDLIGSTLWAVGENSRVFEIPTGGAATTHYYGIMEPGF